MKLQNLASSTSYISFDAIGKDLDLVIDIQDCLSKIGLLDPPSDKIYAPVTIWAFKEFLERIRSTDATSLNSEIAKRLLTFKESRDLFPLHTHRNDLASKIINAISKKGFWISRHPETVNIVYVEGMYPSGDKNDNLPDEFNDSRFVIRISPSGYPEIIGKWAATTEPGKAYTINPANPKGAARISLGQFKAWCIGQHKGKQEALIQVAELPVYRDLNKDYKREDDKLDIGFFGINQHWGYDYPLGSIKDASAGCLVGRTISGHKEFMAICKDDARYIASTGYKFMTTVIEAHDIL